MSDQVKSAMVGGTIVSFAYNARHIMALNTDYTAIRIAFLAASTAAGLGVGVVAIDRFSRWRRRRLFISPK